jgi:hypothetical protein
LRASDIFAITLTGNPGSPSGSGIFTTDGICGFCQPFSLGLLSLTINIGPDSGPNAFDISDDIFYQAFYNRPANNLRYDAENSETNDILHMIEGNWSLGVPGIVLGSGTYSVAPAPEPRSLFLLMPIVALVGLRWRHQRHRA